MPQVKKTDKKIDLDAINRSQMARELGIDVAHVSRVLSGKANPSLKLAVRMAAYLKVSVDAFYANLPKLSTQ